MHFFNSREGKKMYHNMKYIHTMCYGTGTKDEWTQKI